MEQIIKSPRVFLSLCLSSLLRSQFLFSLMKFCPEVRSKLNSVYFGPQTAKNRIGVLAHPKAAVRLGIATHLVIAMTVWMSLYTRSSSTAAVGFAVQHVYQLGKAFTLPSSLHVHCSAYFQKLDM